jgi:hypothetical protein
MSLAKEIPLFNNRIIAQRLSLDIRLLMQHTLGQGFSAGIFAVLTPLQYQMHRQKPDYQ